MLRYGESAFLVPSLGNHPLPVSHPLILPPGMVGVHFDLAWGKNPDCLRSVAVSKSKSSTHPPPPA